MKDGWEGLDGRPRPVPLAPLLEEHDPIPAASDHQGPPNPTSTTLAPTDRPASCLTSRLRLMRIIADLSALRGCSAIRMIL
jgi:hypothetical protein